RFPDELVHLQPEADVELVSEDPFRQDSWIKLAIRGIALGAGILAKYRRKQNAVDLRFQPVLPRKAPCELVVCAIGQDKFNLVKVTQKIQVPHVEGAAFAGSRTLDVHDLVNGWRNSFQIALTTGLQQQGVAASQQALHKGHQFPLLKHWLSAGDFNQSRGGQPRDLQLN